MPLENKLGLTDEAALARAEEKISKTKALELYDTGLLDAFPVGTFAGLQKIHGYLFGEIYRADAHREHCQGQFPVRTRHVSGCGAGKHRPDAPVYL